MERAQPFPPRPKNRDPVEPSVPHPCVDRIGAALSEMLWQHPRDFGYPPTEYRRGWNLVLISDCLERHYDLPLGLVQLRRALSSLGIRYRPGATWERVKPARRAPDTAHGTRPGWRAPPDRG